MFDLSLITELLKVEPGHGFVQSILLAMIWWSSRGVRKEIRSLHDGFDLKKVEDEMRFVKIEGRISVLEKPEVKGV